MLNKLNNIRLGSILEQSDTTDRVKAIYRLEEISADESLLLEALEIKDLHHNRPKLKGVGVYME